MVEHRIGYLIKGVQQAIRQSIDDEVRHLNLSISQYAALNALEGADQLSNAELARACFVTPQTMLQLIKGLEREGWIQRQPHPDHGRIIQTRLTAPGHAVLKKAHRLVDAIEESMVEGLSKPAQERLAVDLKRCQDNLARRRGLR